MRTLPLLLLAACTFSSGADAERDESDSQPTGESTSEGGAEACDDYLACLAVVDPGTFSQLVATYGGDGSCWSSDATADACITVCEEQLALLQEDHADEPACGAVEPDPADWPFDEGDWQIRYIEIVESDCSMFDDSLVDVLNGSAGQFEVTRTDFPNFEMFLGNGSTDCTLDGAAFTCSVSAGGGWMEHTGAFQSRRAASGEFTMDDGDGCVGTISFEMTLD